MADILSGTVNVPAMGKVEKKTLVIVGGIAAVVLGIVWYRSRSATPSDAGANVGINPATGYPFGSAEDLAALAAQDSYVNPAQSLAPGGGGQYPESTGFTTNALWAQAVQEYMMENEIVGDGSTLASALGKYLTGTAMTDAEKALVNQAIAYKGYPPVAGPNGYPPSINTAPPVEPEKPEKAKIPAVPTGLRIVTASNGVLKASWNTVPGATAYQLSIPTRAQYLDWTTGTSFTVTGIPKGLRIGVSVRARSAPGVNSGWVSPYVTATMR